MPLRLINLLFLFLEIDAIGTNFDDHVVRHPGYIEFPAAPYCAQRSDVRTVFFDPVRSLCVILNRENETVPLSAPCPPGSGEYMAFYANVITQTRCLCRHTHVCSQVHPSFVGRRVDEFLCRGEIYSAFEVRCKHASMTLPTRPWFGNQDYQCIQALQYVPNPKRCPEGFSIKKVIDRYGTTVGRRGTVCVADIIRPAEIVETTPIVLANCDMVPDLPRDYEDALHAYDEQWQDDYVKESSYSVPLPGEDKKGQGMCLAVTTNKVVRCPPKAQLLWDVSEQYPKGLWMCLSRIHAPSEMDPTGCAKKWRWSAEFQACIRMEGYIPPLSCPPGFGFLAFHRPGAPRRNFRAPRYGPDDVDYGRCVADTALPDNPYCPPGYFLEAKKKDAAPRCYSEFTYEPTYSCISVHGSSLLPAGPNRKRPTCLVTFDESEFVAGPQLLSKRQRYQNKLILKKPSTTPLDIAWGNDAWEDYSGASELAMRADFAWDEAMTAAMELLAPHIPGAVTSETIGRDPEPRSQTTDDSRIPRFGLDTFVNQAPDSRVVS